MKKTNFISQYIYSIDIIRGIICLYNVSISNNQLSYQINETIIKCRLHILSALLGFGITSVAESHLSK